MSTQGPRSDTSGVSTQEAISGAQRTALSKIRASLHKRAQTRAFESWMALFSIGVVTGVATLMFVLGPERSASLLGAEPTIPLTGDYAVYWRMSVGAIGLVLVRFLIGVYRYAARLTAFYSSRVDVLDIWHSGIAPPDTAMLLPEVVDFVGGSPVSEGLSMLKDFALKK